MKLINVRGHDHIRFHSGHVTPFALHAVPGPGAVLEKEPYLIFCRWRKNSRKVSIEPCHALDEVEEGGTNLR